MIILQCCHYEIVISRVAVTNYVENVRLQRQFRPTDDPLLVDDVIYSKSRQTDI